MFRLELECERRCDECIPAWRFTSTPLTRPLRAGAEAPVFGWVTVFPFLPFKHGRRCVFLLQWRKIKTFPTSGDTTRSSASTSPPSRRGRRWPPQSSVSTRPWRWASGLTAPSISPSTRSSETTDTGRSLPEPGGQWGEFRARGQLKTIVELFSYRLCW